jgi:outer membrane immunogenic protein
VKQSAPYFPVLLTIALLLTAGAGDVGNPAFAQDVPVGAGDEEFCPFDPGTFLDLLDQAAEQRIREDPDVVKAADRLQDAQRAYERNLERISKAENAASSTRAAADAAKQRAANAKGAAQSARATAKAARDTADAAAKSGQPVPPGVFKNATDTAKAARTAEANAKNAEHNAADAEADARKAAERERRLAPLKQDVERAREKYNEATERAREKAGHERQQVVPSTQQSCVPRISRHAGLYAGVGGGRQSTVCNDIMTTEVRSLGALDPLSDERERCLSSAARGSLYFGYGMRAHNWLIAVETDIGFTGGKKSAPAIPGTVGIFVPGVLALNDSMSMRKPWDMSVRARAGRLFTASSLLYGTFGLAVQQIDVTMNCTAAGFCGVNGIVPFSSSVSKTLTGWTLGGGVETVIARNLILRFDYRYSDFGSFTHTFGTPATLAVTTDIPIRTHTTTVGIAYRFGDLFALPRSPRRLVTK